MRKKNIARIKDNDDILGRRESIPEMPDELTDTTVKMPEV